MQNPSGTIRSLIPEPDGYRAVIDIDVEVACPRCAAGKGCGAGLLSGSGRMRRIEASVRPELELGEGDRVVISLRTGELLGAATIVYGAPMLGGVAAATVAYGLGLGDAVAALAALSGLGAGLAAARWKLRKASCLRRYTPIVEKRHESPAGA